MTIKKSESESEYISMWNWPLTLNLVLRLFYVEFARSPCACNCQVIYTHCTVALHTPHTVEVTGENHCLVQPLSPQVIKVALTFTVYYDIKVFNIPLVSSISLVLYKGCCVSSGFLYTPVLFHVTFHCVILFLSSHFSGLKFGWELVHRIQFICSKPVEEK